VNVATYSFCNFNYDSGTFTATWTLSSAVADDKLLLQLDGTSAGGIVDLDEGLLLDGEFTNEVDTLPASGDGVEGGDFLFRINVLRGDANQNGAVTTADVGLTRSRVGNSAGDALYGVLIDANANGAITTADVGFVRSRVGTSLPGGEPAAAFNANAVDAAFEALAVQQRFDDGGARARTGRASPGEVAADPSRSISGFGLGTPSLGVPEKQAILEPRNDHPRLRGGLLGEVAFDDAEWFETLAVELVKSLTLARQGTGD
jgi:hypothetical protein